MAWIDHTLVSFGGAVRTFATTVAALLKGLFEMATGGESRARVEVKRGDPAPDFTLPGSDGRTYRLADLLGDGPIAIAWFPKAFTGG